MRMCRIIAMVVVVWGCAWSASAKAQCVEDQILTSSGSPEPDGFGNAVSISGNTAVVAAEGLNCESHSFCGAVIVYKFDGDSWIEKQQLTAFEPGLFNRFGKSVSVNGNTIVVGAKYRNCTSGSRCGVAFVFRNNGEKWIEQQMLTAFAGEGISSLGDSVSVSGNTILIGATREYALAGAAYMFHFNGTSWVEQQKLIPTDRQAFARFGVSVSVNGNTALVGAYHHFMFTGDREGFSGAAYIFRFNGTSWIEEQVLTAFEPSFIVSSGKWFGWSVSLDGNRAMIGSRPHVCPRGKPCGAAYIYRYDGNSWINEQKLTVANADEIGRFGNSVSLLGHVAIVGAVGALCESGHSCGAAYVYRFDGICWTEQRKLNASAAKFGDNFGISVAINHGTALVGAFNGHCDGESCGAAYVFNTAPGSPCFDCDGDGILDVLDIDCNGNNQADSCDISKGESADCNDNSVPDECEVLPRGQFELNTFPTELSMDGDVVAVCSRATDRHGQIRNAAYVFKSTRSGWGLDEILFADDNSNDDRFCTSIAVNGNRILIGDAGAVTTEPSPVTAYIFEKDGNGWSQQAKLTLPEGVILEGFGMVVALSTDVAVISASIPGSELFGALFVYRLQGKTWTFESKLVFNNEKRLSFEGAALATDGDTIVAGVTAPRGRGHGLVFVYHFKDGQWVEQTKLIGPLGYAHKSRFGEAVAFDDGLIAISDPTGSLSLSIPSNAVHLYRFRQGEWVLEEKIRASRSSKISLLGRLIAMDGDRILLNGLILSRQNVRGVVVVFHRQRDKWVEEQLLFGPQGPNSAFFGNVIGLSGQTAFISSRVDSQEQTHGVLLSFGLGGPDCNENGVLDSCDVTDGTSQDCTSNGFLDECEADCNDNGVADSCDIEDGVEQDCNNNRVPDECDIKQHESQDCNDNHVPDECEADSDHDGYPDDCDQCLDSDTSASVIINSCDSHVPNDFVEDGCTMMDKIDECREKADRHGSFVSCVTKLANLWRKDGQLSQLESSRFARCAAKSDEKVRRRNVSERR